MTEFELQIYGFYIKHSANSATANSATARDMKFFQSRTNSLSLSYIWVANARGTTPQPTGVLHHTIPSTLIGSIWVKRISWVALSTSVTNNLPR